MKRFIVPALVLLAAGMVAAQNVPIYTNQGATELTIGSGGTLVVGPGVLRFVATDTEPSSPAEGWLYWDDSENALKVYSGAAWAALATAGGGTLDQAYDYGGAGAGKAITADSGAVAISSTAADNNGILTLTKNPVGAQSGAGLAVTMGATCTGAGLSFANTGSGNDLLGSGSTWSISKAGAVSCASLTSTGAIYQAAIAAAAAGNVALTVDAAGNGTITVGGISTGNTIFPGVVAFNGNTTLGNAIGDVITITGSVGASVTLDDGVTDSPSLIFKDATDTTATFALVDNAHLGLTTAAASGLKVLTGNLWVGNGAPGTAAMNGEDFYVEGAAEFDSTVQFDGAVTAASTIDLSGAVMQGASPLVFEGLTGDAFETTIAITDPTAARTVTLANATGTVMLSTLAANGPDLLNSVTGASNQLLFEGTADDFEVILTAADAAADATITLPAGSNGTVMLSALATNAVDILNSVTGASNAIVWEGTADAFELSLIAADATQDVSITLPVGAASGTVMLSSLATNAPDIVNSVTGASNGLVFEGTADAFEVTLAAADATADTTATLPNRAGTVALDTASVTAKTQADSPVTVTTASAGQVFTNSGAIGAVVFNLPEASTAIGMKFTFGVLAAQNLDINPDNADQILGLTNAAGDAARNATAGGTVTLLALDATNWVVLGSYGTWADVD